MCLRLRLCVCACVCVVGGGREPGRVASGCSERVQGECGAFYEGVPGERRASSAQSPGELRSCRAISERGASGLRTVRGVGHEQVTGALPGQVARVRFNSSALSGTFFKASSKLVTASTHTLWNLLKYDQHMNQDSNTSKLLQIT